MCGSGETECSVKKLGQWARGGGPGRKGEAGAGPDGHTERAGDTGATGHAERGSDGAGGSHHAAHAEHEAADPDSPKERARRGRWRLVIAVALFATLILPKVISSATWTDPAAAQPSPTSSSPASEVPSYPTASPSGGPTAGPSLSSSPTTPPPTSGLPSPPTRSGPSAGTGAGAGRGAADAAFRSVEAGQCLAVHSNGTGWSRPAPSAATRVECGSDRAYVRVTAVRDGGGCPSGNGRATWSGGGKELCLTRQFRTDQCLLAESGGGEVRAALMSAPACTSERPSGSRFNRLLTITGVHEGDEHCRRDARDRTPYWTWKVDGGARVVCATEAGRDRP